jgi:hypothetical protein
VVSQNKSKELYSTYIYISADNCIIRSYSWLNRSYCWVNRNPWWWHNLLKYILSTTPMFYFEIPPSVYPMVIVIMYHLVPMPESFEIISHWVTLPLLFPKQWQLLFCRYLGKLLTWNQPYYSFSSQLLLCFLVRWSNLTLLNTTWLQQCASTKWTNLNRIQSLSSKILRKVSSLTFYNNLKIPFVHDLFCTRFRKFQELHHLNLNSS